jgi:hypothetical protein
MYFIDTYTWVKCAYNRMSYRHPYRWKDLPSNWRLVYDWEDDEDWEEYEMYCDFIDLLYFYNVISKTWGAREV